MKNNVVAKKGQDSSKKPQSSVTNIVINIGRREFQYDQVRSATLHAPLVDVPINQFSIYRDCMNNDIISMTTNPVDDGVIRVVRVRPEFYEVISGKNHIIAAIFDYKKAVRELGNDPANTGKKVGELVKTPNLKVRLASWKHLNPCEVQPKVLSAEELTEQVKALGEAKSITVKSPTSKVVPIAALFQPPKPAVPKVMRAPCEKFGRIFSHQQAQ